MKKYISPNYKLKNFESVDIITLSIEDNGESSYEYKGMTVNGNKGTAAGWFEDIFSY